MLCFVQDVRSVGGGLSDYQVLLCKFSLVGTCIKRRGVVDGARRIRSEKLRKHQFIEEYARSLEGKRVEWDGKKNQAPVGTGETGNGQKC